MLRRQRSSVSDLKVHLVFTTKYRRKIFARKSLNLIKCSFENVARKMNFKTIEFNGERDHIHLIIEYPPKLSISKIANNLKGVSSRNYGLAGFRKPHETHLWSPSYFVASVGGAPLKILRKYIKNQKSP